MWCAKRRAQFADVWPINQAAAKVPSPWPGWPEGKKFAVVLTHDVEGEDGLVRCRNVMNLERDLGLRSSFNFIPESGYRVSQELRDELTNAGFEVGVHDLRHDGKLFWSHKTFAARAVRINQYLKQWNAVGFRSGFMLRKLGWIHELAVKYDASTFDTDPFEPEPDGVTTIFPFWVPRAAFAPASTFDFPPSGDGSQNGYVELPYTLVQDSTLFLYLQETSIAIWKKKLDWIAEHGGMALLNVHPDYLNFSSETCRDKEYPARHYIEFLHYLKTAHEGKFWNVLPKDLAEWYTANVRSTSSSPQSSLK